MCPLEHEVKEELCQAVMGCHGCEASRLRHTPASPRHKAPPREWSSLQQYTNVLQGCVNSCLNLCSSCYKIEPSRLCHTPASPCHKAPPCMELPAVIHYLFEVFASCWTKAVMGWHACEATRLSSGQHLAQHSAVKMTPLAPTRARICWLYSQSTFVQACSP